MDKEKYFINRFRNNHIGDDAAGINGWYYSKDAFFENVHFKRGWMDAYQIAQKAMLVNISDAIAMNAKPKYALLAVSLPKSMPTHELSRLAKGFEDCAARYGCEIIGGDTIGGTRLDITVTIISHSKAPLLRSGLHFGDRIAFTGSLGQSARGLKRLLHKATLPANHRFIKPALRADFVYEAAPSLRSGMDISDGLYSDLDKMLTANKKGFTWTHRVLQKEALSGEEYEMLIAFSPKKEARIRNLARKHRIALTVIGKVSHTQPRLKYASHHF
ncbi:MAG: thiamine-phosphate kinase [Campylobacterota bacterium]